MRKIILFVISILLTLSLYSQEAQQKKDNTTQADTTVLELVNIAEELPSFPGGAQAMFDFIGKELSYPVLASDLGIEGKVFLGFVVDRQGQLTELTILRGIGGGCDEEALRIIKKMPNWNPARLRGRPVSVEMRIPIQFEIPGEQKRK